MGALTGVDADDFCTLDPATEYEAYVAAQGPGATLPAGMTRIVSAPVERDGVVGAGAPGVGIRPGTPALLNGLRVPIIGRVSMDLMTVDLRGQPLAAVGDELTLWGEGLPVEEIAEAAGTISYELTCSITRRVRFRED